MSKRDQHAEVGFGVRTRLLIVCVALVLLLPAVAGFFTNHKARQNWEKRELASLPEATQLRSSKAFFKSLEAFIDDHIGFATPLNRIYRQVQFYLFKDSPVASVDVGEDGFVFLNSHDVSRPHTAISRLCIPNAVQMRRTAAAMQGFASLVRAQGLSVSYAIVPSKVLLYPEKLPMTVPARFRKACLSLDPGQSAAGQLRDGATGEGYRVYYPFETLFALRDQPAFYPPENFHAASMINHEFARGLLETLGIDPGPAYANGARLEVIRADMDLIGFKRKAQAWIYPYSDYEIVFRHRQPEWVRDHYAKARDFGIFTTAKPASTRSALLLSNSFGKYIAPHLAAGFKTLHHINLNALKPTDAREFLRQLLDQVELDDVIYLIHDGGIPNAPLKMLAESEL